MLESPRSKFVFRTAASTEDWQKLREICCLTAKTGNAIDRDRWQFFGDLWIGPYQKLYPTWAYVVESSGQVVGYLTGCPDTIRMKRILFFQFDLPLAVSVASKKYLKNGDTERFIRRFFQLDKNPEDRFSKKSQNEIRLKFPAHLHANVLSHHRGHGLGRDLCEKFFIDLRKKNIPGVHVFCGPEPVGFYQAIGFSIIEKIEFSPGVWVNLMGCDLRGNK